MFLLIHQVFSVKIQRNISSQQNVPDFSTLTTDRIFSLMVKDKVKLSNFEKRFESVMGFGLRGRVGRVG